MTELRRALRGLPEGAFVDVLESDGAYRFVVDVPGATADDVTVELDAGRLSIEAELDRSPSDRGDARLLESRRDDRIATSLPLPPGASADADATARVERGVLEVTVPRRGVAAAAEGEVSGG